MNTPEQQVRTERALQQARDLIRQEWLAVGKTEQELDHEEQLLTLYSRLLSSGRSEDEIDVEWEHKTPEEILREYAPLVPALHNV